MVKVPHRGTLASAAICAGGGEERGKLIRLYSAAPGPIHENPAGRAPGSCDATKALAASALLL